MTTTKDTSTPVTDTLGHITQTFERMLNRTLALKAKVQEWAATRPQSVICDRHQFLRKIDWDRSTFETATADKFVLSYDPCPACEGEERTAKASQWLKKMGVPDELLHCTIDNYQTRTEGDVDRARAFAEKKRGFFIILGDVGVGKTHLAVALLRLFGRGMFITNDQLLKRLRKTYASDYAEDVIVRCQKTKLLVLDEIGVSSGGVDEQPAIHSILTHRHDHKQPTVITGNITSEQLDDLTGVRLADRFKESTFKKLTLKGESMRERKRQEYFGE